MWFTNIIVCTVSTPPPPPRSSCNTYADRLQPAHAIIIDQPGRTGRVELSRRRIVSITHYWSVSIIERVHGPARTHTFCLSYLPGVSFHYSRHVIQWPPSDLVRHRVANWQLLIAEMQFRFKVSHFSLDKWPALPKVISIIIQVATALVARCRGHRLHRLSTIWRYIYRALSRHKHKIQTLIHKTMKFWLFGTTKRCNRHAELTCWRQNVSSVAGTLWRDSEYHVTDRTSTSSI